MKTSPEGPIRVLHIVSSMKRAGQETWLMHVLRRINREEFAFDFLVDVPYACAYDEEILTRGAGIIRCLSHKMPWQYARNFHRLMQQHGPYHIIHSHTLFYSGFIMQLAAQAYIPIRIAHSHNDTSFLDTRANPLRHLYQQYMRRLVQRYATHGLAASTIAGTSFFGPCWAMDPRWRIQYCGIDLTPFALQDISREAVRSEFFFTSAHRVIGHVGRFDEQKNHAFLIDVFAAASRHLPELRLLLIGDGPFRPAIEHKVRVMGLAERVIFAGVRADVPQLMRYAIDLFVLPSLYEGLPLVMIEAQAAGCHCLISDVLAAETDILPERIHRLPLSAGVTAWADALLELHPQHNKQDDDRALARVCQSAFNIDRSIETLLSFYHEALSQVEDITKLRHDARSTLPPSGGTPCV